jgi:hypothetical protein
LEEAAVKRRSEDNVKQENKMIKVESTLSMKEENIQLQNIKGNVKNAYIKKINSLLNVQQ